MSNWIPHPSLLGGQTVELRPLERTHFSALKKLAADPRIWEHYTFDGTQEAAFNQTLEEALVFRSKGLEYPFVILHKKEECIIGSTRFMNIDAPNRNLEIGFTWLHPDYWSSVVNIECKLLLLNYCFEQLKTIRVQLKTDSNNIRSKKAIEKIGGKFEGLVRNHIIRENGTVRTSALYSILMEEWNDVKKSLKQMYFDKSGSRY